MNQKNKNKKVVINEEYCKECKLCSTFCPDNALEFHEKFNSKSYHPVKWKGNCSLCGMCYIICPDFAIQIKEDDETLER